MTKFESIGAERQYNARSKSFAVRSFENSCERCCNMGLRIECESCGIKYAHELVVGVFDLAEKDTRLIPQLVG